MTAFSFFPVTATSIWPRYGVPTSRGALPGRKTIGPVSGLGTPFTVTSSFGPSFTAPAPSAYVLPKTSRTRNGSFEETVTAPFASATSTRTRATGAGESAVPV